MEDEAATRRERINKALLAWGWGPILRHEAGTPYAHGAVEEYPTASGPADYILFHGGKPLAAVEGKKVAIGPQNVLGQAQRYSRDIEGSPFQFGEYHTPFGYSTNGEVFWFRDLRTPDSRSRRVATFHTPEALLEMLNRDFAGSERWLIENPLNFPDLRPYQRDAIEAIEEALRPGKRKMLLAMATGTGKTRTMIALLYRLLKSGLARRVLFLVDRRALAAQAAGMMAGFEAEPGLKFDRIYEVYTGRFHREDLDENFKFDPKEIPKDYLTNPKPGSSFIYVCTVQRMRVNLFGRPDAPAPPTGDVEEEEPDAGKLDIPIDAFDCVIADECHRGYTAQELSKWREVLEYFDAIRIGLTATPAAHTKAYFEDIIFRYDYETAVAQGYLVDYTPVIIESDVRMNGVFLRPGEEVRFIDTKTGLASLDVMEDEREFDASEVERRITAPDSNRKIVAEYLRYARDFERDRGRFPKTLVFAVNDLSHTSHADQLMEILRSACGHGDDFVSKITGSPTVDRPLQRIREFRNRDVPAIAVTVDMLTTGVDVPKLEALLFLRPVKSRILFEQMLGRGTRTCPDIHKGEFLVFDAVGVLDYFRNVSEFSIDPPDAPVRPLPELVDAVYRNEDREYATRILVKRMQRVAKAMAPEGWEQFATFIPDGDLGAFARGLPAMLEKDWRGTMDVLRNPAFLDLLENYPRPARTFIVADTVEDVVSSEAHFKTSDGRDLKPRDYIQEWEEFVLKNPDGIEAIRILQNKPADLSIEVLTDLRQKLAKRPEKFTEENLRKAYHKELADIISIVRHAALNEPLATAQERVDRAMAKVREGKTFTPQQEMWLGFVHDHLIRNLAIEPAHFETPPFSRHGAWRKANADFDGKLGPLLTEINVAVVTAVAT